MDSKFCPYAGLSVIFTFIAMLLWPAQGAAALDSTLFDRVKTGYVLNFTKFVSWPDSAFTDDDSPFVVGFIGNNDSLYDALLKIQIKSIKKRKVEIRRLEDSRDVRQCHLIYLATPLGRSPEALLGRIAGQPVLTVSDQPEFVSAGGMIQLVEKQNYLRFRINLDVVRRAGLDMSSQLLNLADQVIHGK